LLFRRLENSGALRALLQARVWQRRDEKLNEQMIPIYDPSRRLFLASEDPSHVDPEMQWQT
jgi:hypothetical protein